MPKLDTLFAPRANDNAALRQPDESLGNDLELSTRETLLRARESVVRRPRVLISHQGCVPIYRRPFFERLARKQDIEYVVAVGAPPRGTDYMAAQPPYAFSTLAIKNHEISLGGKSLIWQPLAARYWSSFDAIVLGEELKYVSHLALSLISKLKCRPLLWWGFGAPPASVTASSSRTQWSPSDMMTRYLRRQATGYLSYTESGRAALQAEGMDGADIAVLNNTVDMEHQRKLRDQVATESNTDIRAKLRLPAEAPVLLFFGRFLASKHVDLLIRYVQSRRASNRPAVALISGGGRYEERLYKIARGAPDIIFRKLDDLDLARALKTSIAIVIPGFVGLAVTHGFAHGVPMITRAGVHPPEIEYLQHGENGLILPENEEGFFAGLDAFIASPEMQAKLSAGAAQSAAAMSMDAMANRFHTLMLRVLGRTGRLRPDAR